jgi:hypothetical protein
LTFSSLYLKNPNAQIGLKGVPVKVHMKLPDIHIKYNFKKLSPAWYVGAVILLCFFYNLNGAPLFDLDEGAFSEATREMFERKDFISPYLDGNPRYDKPILIYWFQAASMLVFGISAFSFRLPSACFAAVWIIAIYRFARSFIDKKTGSVAAIIAATTLGVSIIGKAATADALLNMTIALCMLDCYRFYTGNKSRHLYVASMWAGLGFLTKGPIALLIPGAVTFLFFLSQKQWRRWILMILNPIAVLIFCVIVLPWNIAQYVNEGQAFIKGFFLVHNIDRYLSTMEGHGGRIWYYIPVPFLLVLPYTALLIRTFIHVREISHSSLDKFLWIWFFFVLLFFSFSNTQLPHYLLYGCTPLFLLMGRYRNELRTRHWSMIPSILLFLLLVLLPYLIHPFLPYAPNLYIKDMLSQAKHVFGLAYLFWLIIALFVCLGLIVAAKLKPWKCLIVAGIFQAFILAHLVMPIIGEVQQGPVKEAALLAKEKGYDVIMYGLQKPSFSVYRDAITPQREPRPGDIVFTKIDRVTTIKYPYEIFYNRGGIVLARVLEKKEP